MTRRILTSILPLFLLVGCPEPEAPNQPGAGGAPGGAPAMNAPGGAPAMNAPGGAPPTDGPGAAPPVPEGTAPGAQDGDGNPGSVPVPQGTEQGLPGQVPNMDENPMPDPAAASGLAPDEQTIPCGDGECDDAEKNDANLCPRDCSKTAPEGGDWCGDGICDALEEYKGDCAKDCK
jgi:hypothetical protein